MKWRGKIAHQILTGRCKGNVSTFKSIVNSIIEKNLYLGEEKCLRFAISCKHLKKHLETRVQIYLKIFKDKTNDAS